MSDEDDFLSEESYEFEFEDDDEVEQESNDDNISKSVSAQQNQAIENDYYVAKSLKDEDLKLAINLFEKLVDYEMNDNNIEWIFKCYKQIIKCHFFSHEFDKVVEYLQKLEMIIPKINNRNYLEDSINKMFNTYSNTKNKEFELKFYDKLISCIDIIGHSVSNDRLWIKINLNKFNLYLNKSDLELCSTIVNQLNDKLTQVSEMTQNSFSLEVIAAEIELLSLHKHIDLSRLYYLYKKSLTITSPVTHPRIIGIIKECGGKIYFFKQDFEKARLSFYESFKNFDESGSPEKKKTLKYLILCSIITENEFNPFESQETQHYSQLPEFEDLLLIIECYNELDLEGYRRLLDRLLQPPSNNESGDDDDSFFREPIFTSASKTIEKNLVEKIVLNLFKSYSVIRFDYIEDLLALSETQLKQILFQLGNSGKLINVKVNFADKVIEISDDSKIPNLPVTLDSESILKNFKCLDMIGVDYNNVNENDDDTEISYHESDQNIHHGDEMNIDSHPVMLPKTNKAQKTSLLYKFLFVNNEPVNDKQWIQIVDEWFELISKAFPIEIKNELSTKDQIFTEQKAELIGNTDVLNKIRNDLDETQSHVDHKIEKIGLLQSWLKHLFNYRHS